MSAPPDGTRFVLPHEAALRSRIVGALRLLFDAWGYARVDTPALEHYDPAHPRAAQSFKLSDRDSDVLALRADFTPAIANLVRATYPDAAEPRRFQYCGTVWQAIHPDFARTREFTQLGLELVGVSNPRADAELIHLARESVRAVDLVPRVEVGLPGFVRALFDLAEIPEAQRDDLAEAIDRKDRRGVQTLLEPHRLAPDLNYALVAIADLYGDVSSLQNARRLAPWPETKRELDALEAVLSEFEDLQELLLDFGRARRLSYYTGVTFQAYTFDFGQPLLGGGRYDGALLPYAAGFSVGVERLLGALPGAPHGAAPNRAAPLVLSLDDLPARRLRAAGVVVERSLFGNAEEARAYALRRGVPYLLSEAGLEPLTPERPRYRELSALLEKAHS